MDGVDQLNNVLIIGMTNRMDMIDEALLRPGRLEVHIEISLPDEAGRFQILNIHTNKMRTNGVMSNDVDLAELASLTKNFSGAEIGGLVKSATSFAFNRHVKVCLGAELADDRLEPLLPSTTSTTSKSAGQTFCTHSTRSNLLSVCPKRSFSRSFRMALFITRSALT